MYICFVLGILGNQANAFWQFASSFNFQQNYFWEFSQIEGVGKSIVISRKICYHIPEYGSDQDIFNYIVFIYCPC